MSDNATGAVLREFVVTFFNKEEGDQDIEIVEAEDKEKAREKFLEEYGEHKILLIEKI